MPAKKETLMGNLITFDTSRRPDIPDDGAPLGVAAAELAVVDDDSFQRGASLMATCAARTKTIEDFFEKSKKLANDLHKSICADIKTMCAPYAKTREILEAKMRRYRLEQEQARADAQRQLEAAGAAARAELEAASHDARRLGDIRTARVLEEQAGSIADTIVLPDTRSTAEGLNERRPWIATVTNPFELIRAVAEGRVKLMHNIIVKGCIVEVPIIEVNETVLGYLAKKMGKDLDLPGVRSSEDVRFAVSKKV